MLRNISKLISGSLLSRVLGFSREMIVTYYFGTVSKIADAFSLAATFTNIFRQVLGEDMVERAFMPPFKTIYDKGDKAGSWKFLSVVLNWFFFILLGTTLLMYVVIPLFFELRAAYPGIFGANEAGFDYELSLNLIMIVLPFMLLIGLAAFVGSLLNFFERNWIFSFAPVMLSVGVILGIVFFEHWLGGYALAVGYVLGAFLQLLIQLPFIFSKKFRAETGIKYHKILKTDEFDFKVLNRESKLITLNAFFNKSSELFTRVMATSLYTGANASLTSANYLYQMPSGIISLSIARGITPELNRLKSQDNKVEFGRVFNKGIKLYFLLIVPVTIFLMIGSPEIIYLAYFRGKFDLESLNLTRAALDMYLIGLLPMSLVGYYYRVLSLFSKNKYALIVSVFNSITNIILAYILAKFTSLGHAGIALSTSLSLFLNLKIISSYFKKEMKDYLPEYRVLNKEIVLLLSIFASLYAACKYYDLYFYNGYLQSFVSLGIKGAVIALLFGGWIMVNKETAQLVKPFMRKILRRR